MTEHKSFSEFIRCATDEEKKEIYMGAMKTATDKQNETLRQAKEEPLEGGEPLTGLLETPQQRTKLFYSYNEMLEWLKFSRPAAFQMQSGVVDGKAAWQLTYIGTEGV